MSEPIKIRVHSARIENRYGVTTAFLLDDPVEPQYLGDELEKRLMFELNYEPDEEGESGYPGLWDGEVGSYYDYDGYTDVFIPDTIVQRINKG